MPTARRARRVRPSSTGPCCCPGRSSPPALLTGAGVETYRSAFPAGRAPEGRSPDDRRGRTTTVNRPSRIATHAVAGVLLGLLTVAVVAGLVAALLASPLLLAPAGGASLLAFAGIGAGHSALTRRLVDRT